MQLKLTSEHSISQVVIRLLHESSTTRDSTSTLSQLLTLRCYCTALETSSRPQEQAVSWERAPAGCRAASPEHYSFALQSQQPPSVCFESFSTQYLGESSAYSQSRKVFQTALCATYKIPAVYNWKPVWTPDHPRTLKQHRAPELQHFMQWRGN